MLQQNQKGSKHDTGLEQIIRPKISST